MSLTTKDKFELRLLPHPGSSDDSQFAQIEIRINGIPLLDLVAAAEEDLTQREFNERVAAGETSDNLRIPPGAYMYPTLGRLKRTGELSFGNAQDHFLLEPDDSAFDATAILVLQR